MIKVRMMQQGTQSVQMHNGHEVCQQKQQQQQQSTMLSDSRKHHLDESAWEQEQEPVTSSDEDQKHQQRTKQQEDDFVNDEQEYISESDDDSISQDQPNDDNDELLAWMDLYTEELIWNTKYNRMMISMSFAFANKENAQPIVVERKIRRADSSKMSQIKQLEHKRDDVNARKKSKLSDTEARSAKWKTLRMANIPAFGMGLAKAADAATSNHQQTHKSNTQPFTPAASAAVTNPNKNIQPLKKENSLEKPKLSLPAPNTASSAPAEQPKFRFFPAKPLSPTSGIANTLSSVASGLSSMSTSPAKPHATPKAEPVALPAQQEQQPQQQPVAPAKPLAYKSYLSSSSTSSISSVESDTKKKVQFSDAVPTN